MLSVFSSGTRTIVIKITLDLIGSFWCGFLFDMRAIRNAGIWILSGNPHQWNPHVLMQNLKKKTKKRALFEWYDGIKWKKHLNPIKIANWGGRIKKPLFELNDVFENWIQF